MYKSSTFCIVTFVLSSNVESLTPAEALIRGPPVKLSQSTPGIGPGSDPLGGLGLTIGVPVGGFGAGLG
jgi:hypothetical protein